MAISTVVRPFTKIDETAIGVITHHAAGGVHDGLLRIRHAIRQVRGQAPDYESLKNFGR